VYRRFAEVDQRLLSITPTDNVSRAPRSLNERADYRGHEWFQWIVFYSIPVLKNILPNRFLSHWGLLVHGIVLIMQNSVSKSELVYAGRYFKLFNSDIDTLYGPEHVTFSTHLLTHLVKSTENFGQPWTHSAFLFESFNGELKSAVHSSNGVAHQISKHMQLKIALQRMRDDLECKMSDKEKDYFKSVMCSVKRLAEPTFTSGDVSFHGQPKTIKLPLILQRAIVQAGFMAVVEKEYLVYDRCIVNNEVFQSRSYSRVFKQNNYTVLLKSNQVFEIHFFIVFDNVCLALGHYLTQNLQANLCDVHLPHIRVLNEACEESIRCVPISHFEMKLMSFSVSTDCESIRVGCINVLKMEMLT
jgi:hypothetical protein